MDDGKEGKKSYSGNSGGMILGLIPLSTLTQICYFSCAKFSRGLGWLAAHY